MKWIYFCIGLCLASLQSVYSQHIDLQFKLVDDVTLEPITDAHVFISSSSIGTFSDDQGKCSLGVPVSENQTLVISHISYESLVIDPSQYRSLMDGRVVQMTDNGLDLDDVVIIAKPSGKWKRNYKRFRTALLGEDVPDSKCKILNPEVLRFEDKDGIFSAIAIDRLEIDNVYLGYKIDFWLEELVIDADGSRHYKGNVHYIDQLDLVDVPKKRKRREKIYVNSLPHFLRSLILSPDQNALEERGYRLSVEQYDRGVFERLGAPGPQELITVGDTPGHYQLHFVDFLTVEHHEVYEDPDAIEVSVSKAEQQKFGATPSMSLGKKQQAAISRLYKIQPFLIFDIRGNIINKSAVKEYGFWADQNLATTLPIDYRKFSDFEVELPSSTKIDTLHLFLQLVGKDKQKKEAALATIKANWSPSYIAPLLDILRLSGEGWHEEGIKTLLKEHVPQIKPNYYEGIDWLWQHDLNYGTYYSDFKAHLYSAIDTSFYNYFFNRGGQSQIRLDEIVWGGVRKDGIPPLRSPQMISARDASYLAEGDIVFGVIINGFAYAYPKRVLAWHEFFTDDIAGQAIAGVYCTLCGTVIIYNTEVDGVRHELGTSGFLYRSNKLMYDQATQSLWSTIKGRPVMGPLISQDIELTTLPVVTTTWGDWRDRHTDSQVLSLETGYARNYDEGEAYKDYFSHDRLMFPVPEQDGRLAKKS